MLKIGERAIVKADEYRHDFRTAYTARPIAPMRILGILTYFYYKFLIPNSG
jgi:hypothetical protein